MFSIFLIFKLERNVYSYFQIFKLLYYIIIVVSTAEKCYNFFALYIMTIKGIHLIMILIVLFCSDLMMTYFILSLSLFISMAMFLWLYYIFVNSSQQKILSSANNTQKTLFLHIIDIVKKKITMCSTLNPRGHY